MEKITNITFLFICSICISFIGMSNSAFANSNNGNLTFAPNQPAGFVVFDEVGEEPVNPGEVFLACGPNQVEEDNISYRLFYTKSNEISEDPTTLTEYTFGTTAGDGEGTTSFGFRITGLEVGTEYTFYLYQFDSSDDSFSTPAVATQTSGGDSSNGDDNGDDVITEFVVIQDFEDESTFTFAGFEGLGGASIEAAPSGSNGNSFKLESVTSGNPWQGAEIVQNSDLLDLRGEKTVEVDVYSTQAFNLLLKVEVGGPNSAASQSYTTPNEWQTLTFTMDESQDGTAVADGVYEKIVFFPNWNGTDTGFDDPQTFTVYIDNVKGFTSETGDDDGDGDDDGGDNEGGEETLTVDASANWTGYTNVFDLPSDGGDFVFGSDWGLSDLRTDLNTEANTLTLYPNFNTYDASDDFWTTPEGEGNKIFEGVTRIESTALAGKVLTFRGNVESFTISSDYEVTAFIRVFNADFSLNKAAIFEITQTGEFEVIYDEVGEDDVNVQYGFTVTGVNANPADEASLGNVVVGPTTLSSRNFDPIELQVYPNPVSDVLQIKSTTNFSSVELYSLNGRLLVKQSNNEAIDMRSFSNGMYLLRLTSEGNSITKKVIKK